MGFAGIAPDDDDGNAGSAKPVGNGNGNGVARIEGPITQGQYDELMKVAEDVGANEADETRLLKFFKIPYLQELPAARFGEAVSMLKQRGARQ